MIIQRFDLDTGLVRRIDGHSDSPLVAEVAEELAAHLKHRAELRNLIGSGPPRTSAELKKQESLRRELRYHLTPLHIGFERHDWSFAAFVSRSSGDALHIVLRTSEFLEHGGHDHGPPLVAAMMEFTADDTLFVRMSRAKLATTDDASAAILEADLIIDALAAAWLRISVPPPNDEQP